MPEDNGLFSDEFELPKNRRKRIMNELDEIDDDSDVLLPYTTSDEKNKIKRQKEAEKEEKTDIEQMKSDITDIQLALVELYELGV